MISMMQISLGDSNSTVLMKSCASAPMIAAGRKAIRMPRTKCRVSRSCGRSSSICHSRPEIDAEDRQDGAELDQDLEGLAGRLEAEEMAGKQDMAGRGDRNELGQALEQAEQQGFDDRLAFHG